MLPRYLTEILAAMLVLPMFCGCGPSRSETAPVTGKVTFHGNPVPEGTIAFYPENGRFATGRIQPDGTYVLTTFEEGDGALTGNHVVMIEAVRFAKGPQPKSMQEEVAMAKKSKRPNSAMIKPKWLIPQKYANRTTSGLTAEVSAGKNTIDFDLPN